MYDTILLSHESYGKCWNNGTRMLLSFIHKKNDKIRNISRFIVAHNRKEIDCIIAGYFLRTRLIFSPI